MARMNALLVQFPVQPELVSHDDKRWHVHLAGHGSVADRFAAGAVIGVALTVSMLGVNRLGVCAIAACPRVFLDASPGKSRRYCSEHAPAKGNVSTLRRQSNGQPPRTSATGTLAAARRDATPAAS
jgi:predicted RNA-binding Zn ribbon-like protein